MMKRRLLLSFAAASALLLSADSVHHDSRAQAVAIVATGTNGGRDVQADTEKLIDRVRAAGYRVVVIPPRNVDAQATADNRNLLPRHAAVMAAAKSRGADVIMPTHWADDGFHIGTRDIAAIGQQFKGAATFGDSNSVFINRITGGHCFGVSGMQTHDMLASQFPLPATDTRTAPQPCRSLRDVLPRIKR